jgi:transposase
LAICYLVETKPQHLEVSNKASGFKQLLKECGSQSLYVMEATGAYYMQLAYFLHEQGCQVAVLNPVIIKRFIQMHLGKGKSDKKDAQWIMRYGQQHELKIWQPEQALLVECRQLEQVIEQLIRQKTMTINSWEALQLQPVKSRLAIKSLLLTLKTLEKQIQQMEDQLQDNLGTLFGKEMKLLRSSPGIGDQTAGMLLLFAGGFRDFTNYRQLIAKAGYHLVSTLPDPASAAK